MFDKTHSAIARPALLVIVADNVLVVRIRVLSEEALDEVSRVFFIELQHNIDLVNIAHVKTDRVPCFSFHVLETHELVVLAHRTGKLKSSLLTKDT